MMNMSNLLSRLTARKRQQQLQRTVDADEVIRQILDNELQDDDQILAAMEVVNMTAEELTAGLDRLRERRRLQQVVASEPEVRKRLDGIFRQIENAKAAADVAAAKYREIVSQLEPSKNSAQAQLAQVASARDALRRKHMPATEAALLDDMGRQITAANLRIQRLRDRLDPYKPSYSDAGKRNVHGQRLFIQQRIRECSPSKTNSPTPTARQRLPGWERALEELDVEERSLRDELKSLEAERDKLQSQHQAVADSAILA